MVIANHGSANAVSAEREFAMTRSQPRRCAYCGIESDDLTRDHVVPSALWDKGFRSQYPMIVPACRPCQDSYDREAEYFRNCLVAMLPRGSQPEAERLLVGPVTRSLNRSRRSIAELVRGMRPFSFKSPGGLFIGQRVGFQIELPRINRVIEKIVRGMYFFKSHCVFPATHEVCIHEGNAFWKNQQILQLIQQMTGWEGQGDTVFQCRYVKDINDPDTIALLLVFFENMGFFVLTQRKEFCGLDLAGANNSAIANGGRS